MNTDNMALSGEPIDYGPGAFMETYDPATVFSSIDHSGRYAYGNQPPIAQWNLARLADAMLPLFDRDIDKAVERATAALDRFPNLFEQHWLDGMRTILACLRGNRMTTRLSTTCSPGRRDGLPTSRTLSGC